MPPLAMHWAQAEHNRKVAYSLLSATPSVKDWAITVAFYAMVHYLEGVLALKPEKHSDNQKSPHEFRLQKARKYLSHSGAKSYAKLYQLSRLMRYLCYRSQVAARASGDWMNDADAQKNVGKVEVVRLEASQLTGMPL